MKKWLCLILALVMVLSFTACDDDSSSKRDDDEEETSSLYASTIVFRTSGDLDNTVYVMKNQDFYETVAELAQRDLTAEDVEDMLTFETEGEDIVNVTITHEAPRTLQAVRKAVIDQASVYAQSLLGISVTTERVGDIDEVEDTDDE